MATYLVVIIVALFVAVLNDTIFNVAGWVIETARQWRFNNKSRRDEEGTMTRNDLMAQVSQLTAAVVSLQDRIMQFEATQTAPVAVTPTLPLANDAIENVPWFDGDVVPAESHTAHTVAAKPTPKPTVRKYKVPLRLQSNAYCAIDNVLYTWVGRNGQAVYGMTVAMAKADGTIFAQIVDSATLKPKSRVVTLPARAERLGTNNAIAKQTAPVAQPTSAQTEPQDTTPKPHMVFTSKRTNLIARLDNGQINVASADDTGTAVAMIRKGFVPQAMTHEQLAQLVQSNPKHWTK